MIDIRQTVIASLMLLAATAPAAAQKSSGSTCTAAFTNTGIEGITDEGNGAYVHGKDGTRCEVLKSDGGGTSGDLLFTLNYVRRAKATRSALLYLNNPVEGSVSRSVWTVGGNFHLKIKGLGDIPIGATVENRAGFHVPYSGENYKFRYGWDAGDGTSSVLITRRSATQWTISSQSPHIARLWTGGSFGDGTVYAWQGDYYSHFVLTIMLN